MRARYGLTSRSRIGAGETGRTKQTEKTLVYANRRRTKGARGRELMKKRGELLERLFAHICGTGGMRRTHLREHDNILKRMLIHVAGCNLGLLMRELFGAGTPRSLQGRRAAFLILFTVLLMRILSRLGAVVRRASRSAEEISTSLASLIGFTGHCPVRLNGRSTPGC